MHAMLGIKASHSTHMQIYCNNLYFSDRSILNKTLDGKGIQMVQHIQPQEKQLPVKESELY